MICERVRALGFMFSELLEVITLLELNCGTTETRLPKTL